MYYAKKKRRAQQTNNNIDPLGNSQQQTISDVGHSLVQQPSLNNNSLQQHSVNQLIQNNTQNTQSTANQIQNSLLGNPNISNSTSVNAAAAAAAAQSMLLGKIQILHF